MKVSMWILGACAAIVVTGCGSSYGSGAAADSKTEPAAAAAATATTEPAATETTSLPADVKVAEDGVVRNAKGEAYCVVMNQVVDKASEADMPRLTQDGVTYVFCCKSCPPMFEKDPAKYAVAKN